MSCQTQMSHMDRERQAHEAGGDTGYLGVVGGRAGERWGMREKRLGVRWSARSAIRLTNSPLV